MSSDPKDIVVKFLKENGYPFEMKIAREFQKKGFGIIQSSYFNDPNMNVAREIDLVALWRKKFLENNFTIIFAVECKYAKTPWVLFSSLTKRKDNYYSGNANARKWLNHLHKQPHFEFFFEINANVGHGLTSVTNENDKQKDNAYKAIQTILSFLKSENTYPKFSYDGYTIIVPIIAVRGKLFESQLNEDDEIEINEIKEAQLFYNEGGLGIIPKIHIVTESILTEYITRLYVDTQRLFVEPYLNNSVLSSDPYLV